MKPWSLVVLLFAAVSICMSGCQKADTKSDPAFKKDKAPEQKMDRETRTPEAPPI